MEIFSISNSFTYVKTPVWKTVVSLREDGSEQRRAKWVKPIHRFSIGFRNITNQGAFTEINDLYRLFLSHQGAYTAFLFKDTAHDYSTTGESIGTGDAAASAFQLKKAYTYGSTTFTDNKKYIVAASETVYVAGTPKTRNTHYTIDNDTGIITFTSGNIPGVGEAITADFEFYYKVRFAEDELSFEIFRYLLANVALDLVEVLT